MLATHTSVSRDELRKLIEHTNAPCLSLFLATYPPGETQQRAIQMENLLRRGETELAAGGYDRSELDAMLARAWELTDPRVLEEYQGVGLAVYVAPGLFRLYQVAQPIYDMVVVGRRPHVKLLLTTPEAVESFYVLAVSKNRVRLLHATPRGIVAMPLPDAPRSLSDALQTDMLGRQAQRHVSASTRGGASGAMYPGHGGGEPDEKADIQHYLQLVSSAVHRALHQSREPLVLAGVDYLLSIYRAVNDYPYLAGAHIAGSPDHLTDEVLCAQGAAVLASQLHLTSPDDEERFQKLVQHSPPRASANLRTILPAAHAGRVARLLVASDRQVWGWYNPADGTLSVHETPMPGDEDLLDTAAQQTLLHGGEATAIPVEKVPGGEAAAFLRY